MAVRSQNGSETEPERRSEHLTRQVPRPGPEVTVVDVRPLSSNGTNVAQQASSTRPAPKVVIISRFGDPKYVVELLSDGPEGKTYLVKTSEKDIGVPIRAVEAISEEATESAPAFAQVETQRHSRPGAAFYHLTGRQREVLALMAAGYTNAAVAQKLAVEERTVENHTHSIYAKLGLSGASGYHRRVQAVLAYQDLVGTTRG